MEQSYLLIIIILIVLISPSVGYSNKCIEYSNGYCLRCMPGLRLVEGRCMDMDPGCLVYSQDSCVGCADGRQPNHGICTLAKSSLVGEANDENNDMTLY